MASNRSMAQSHQPYNAVPNPLLSSAFVNPPPNPVVTHVPSATGSNDCPELVRSSSSSVVSTSSHVTSSSSSAGDASTATPEADSPCPLDEVAISEALKAVSATGKKVGPPISKEEGEELKAAMKYALASMKASPTTSAPVSPLLVPLLAPSMPAVVTPPCETPKKESQTVEIAKGNKKRKRQSSKRPTKQRRKNRSAGKSIAPDYITSTPPVPAHCSLLPTIPSSEPAQPQHNIAQQIAESQMFNLSGDEHAYALSQAIPLPSGGQRNSNDNTSFEEEIFDMLSSEKDEELISILMAEESTGPAPPPQRTLNHILSSRGYATSTHSAMDCNYCTPPTSLQLASFGTALLKAIEKGDDVSLSQFMWCGLSPNPCNAFGDNTLCMSIKRGLYDLFQCQLEAGASVHIADSFGRTPLHFAAWAAEPDFRTVQAIISRDPNILRVTDKHGRTPLDYLTEEKYAKWNKFLEEVKGCYWPVCGADKQRTPHVVRLNSSDPANALPVELAKKVSAGKVSPKDAMTLRAKDFSPSECSNSLQVALTKQREVLQTCLSPRVDKPKGIAHQVAFTSNPKDPKAKLDTQTEAKPVFNAVCG